MTERETIDALQKEIGDWADKTFPNSTPESKVAHLKREVQELSDSHDPSEVADCMLLLFHYAHMRRVSAIELIRKKFEIVKKRKWQKPDAEGVVEHVREE